MPTIHCQTKLYRANNWTIARLPASASAELPSRGQVMVEGTINGYPFKTPLEPDGKWSHWFQVDQTLMEAARVAAGDSVKLELTLVKDWPEPAVPAEIQRALAAAPQAHALWQQITPMARWEWVRWIRSTGQQETRERRVTVAMSKLTAGTRRPCCWNRNLSTEPSVSKNGVLLEPAA